MDEPSSKMAASDSPAASQRPTTDVRPGSVDDSPTAPRYVVGVGASAGGLEALEQFFEQVPLDAGLAFVVIQHLSPDFKSLMDELLSRRTRLAIHRVEDGMLVEPNAIYLIPPKKEMIIAEGRLLLTDKDPATGLSLPIDTFFRSLAEDQEERAVAVVLSGTGSDGSRGALAVHEAGGLVIAQSEETAKFDGMPRSAIETGAVDLVLAPAAVAQALLDHVKSPWLGIRSGISPRRTAETDMNAVYELLRQEYGIDFSQYKPNTVLRRLDRRLQINRSVDLAEYVNKLESDPRELNSLYKDLLIGVTRFFRDPGLFERLAHEVIPNILASVSPNDGIRVWIAGCATGEEAYSLAILLHEALGATKRPINVKIFATDVHRSSLEFASSGAYAADTLTEVSPQRLERYFTRQKSGYLVSQDLRKMIVFAPHNVIKDAPFTKLDLISCRNLLIYLQPHAQQKALSLFHFGLKKRGLMVLGPSESPGAISDEFETLDGRWKIYSKRRDVRLSADMRLPLSPLLPQMQALSATFRSPKSSHSEPPLVKAYEELLGLYVPPSFLVNAQRELLHTFSGAGQFLRVPDGKAPTDVVQMVHQDLRLAISSAMQRAIKDRAPVAYGNVAWQAGRDERVRICVRPLQIHTSRDACFLISLEPEAQPPKTAQSVSRLEVDAASQKQLDELEDELRHTKENLQATVEEMETTNEELQATNEELVASNEELQSTNEELHSVNEELYTVNAEYQRKITELTELTDDMDNLLRSTDVGTIFLDRELLIRKFTPKIAHAFQLLPQDIGRRIDSFAHNILHPGLLDDVRRVLETAEPFERDVQDQLGKWFLLRILPYRTKGRVEGVVVTLIDISRLKATEQELRRVSKVFMDGADPIIIEDMAGQIVDLNRETERAYGWSREDLIGQSIALLVPPDYQDSMRSLREQCRDRDSVRNVESVRRDRFGRAKPVLLTLSPLYNDASEPAAIASIAKDITAQKKAEDDAREATSRRDQFLAMLSHELRNPLGAMLNATRLFNQAVDDPAARERACSAIERQSKHMARLLDDLLDVARVTQGKIHIRDEVVDLGAITNDAVHVIHALFGSYGHHLAVDLTDEPVYVEGDSARLLQVQENLLANAAKYTPAGGQIRVSLRKERREAVLCVRDNGVGIDPEMHEKIFDLFVRGPHDMDRNGTGMGIGLTMVRTIVALHHGQVSVRSEGVGKGSEFEVRLPLTDKRPKPPTVDLIKRADGVRVLVVEDNVDSRELLASLLVMDGYLVSAASDGIEGYKAIVSELPDVALVDINLPGIDGYEIARRVRANDAHKSVRLVALTGYGRSADRTAVIDAGFDEHLVKPVAPEDLARVLRKPR